MASQKAISGNPYVKNGSTILGGSPASTSTNGIENLTIRNSASRNRTSTLPVVSSNQGNAKANNSRTFAGMEDSNFVIMGTAFNLGGVASTVLRSPSSVPEKAVKRVTSSRQVSLSGLQWASSAGMPTYTLTKTSSTITYTTDNGDTPRVTFLFGSANPTSSTI